MFLSELSNRHMSSSALADLRQSNTRMLHRNVFVSSLQLLGWLLFKPSAWRAHLDRIDRSLKPDFTLLELSEVQRGDPLLQRTILVSWFIRSCWVVILVSLVLVTAGASSGDIAFGVTVGVGVGMASAVVGDVSAGMAVGLAGGFVGGVAAGIGYGLAGVESLSGILAMSRAGVTVMGVASCLGLGTASGTINVLSLRSAEYSWRWPVGIGMSIVLSSCIYGIAFLAHWITVRVIGGTSFHFVFELELAICFSALVCLTRGWKLGLAAFLWFAAALHFASLVFYGAKAGLGRGILQSSVQGATASLADGMLICLLYIMPYALARYIAGPPAGAVAGMLGAGGAYLFFSLSVSIPPLSLRASCLSAAAYTLLGLTLVWWRAVLLYPFVSISNILSLRADKQRPASDRSLLYRNAAFWDEIQFLPQVGLEQHLVLTMERRPAIARDAIGVLAASRQHWAVHAAQIEMGARQLELCKDIAGIGDGLQRLTAAELEGPASFLLRSFGSISQDVKAALNQVSTHNRRLNLSAVQDRLDKLVYELTPTGDGSARNIGSIVPRGVKMLAGTRTDREFRGSYARRFLPIALGWRRIVMRERSTEESRQWQEIANPYVPGTPLDEHQEIFVGRGDVAALIERRILSTQKGAVLLYGQRRIGKTSLLKNLGLLLPSTVVPMFVDLQGTVTSNLRFESFLHKIARDFTDSALRHRNVALPLLRGEDLENDPSVRFDQWLDEVERTLGERTGLFEFDELEVLEEAISSGRIVAEDVMGVLRHIIQHRPRFNVLLCGSHNLGEIKHLSSYLVNVHVIKLGYLNEREAQRLVNRPVKDFALRYAPEAAQRVLDVTRRHAALVQLLCYTIVELKNEQDPALRWTVRLDDVEAAIARALVQGTLFIFVNIEQMVGEAGRDILCFMALRGENAVTERDDLGRRFPENLEKTIDLLLTRDIVERTGPGYRFQVEMIRRWFARSEDERFG
jgi:hypothetical protein